MRKLVDKICSILTSVVFIAFLLSCHKEEKKTTYVAQELKEFYGYDIGSYWIFYDSVSMSIDSMYVENNITGISHSDYTDDNEYVDISFIDENLSNKSLSSYYVLNLSSGGTPSAGMRLQLLSGKFIRNLALGIGIPFKEQRKQYNDTDIRDCSFISKYDPYPSESYSTVYRFYNGYEKSYDIIYMNKDNGFIDIVNNNKYLNKRMHLLRQNIIRMKK